MTLTPAEVRARLAAHGLEPSRALGQNFVADPNTVRRIARLAGVGPGDRVVEIGPGLGSLTLALVETGAAVTAVEADRHLVPVLAEAVADAEPPVTIRHDDATTLAWADDLASGPWVLVANLPYNVATSLVLDVLDLVPAVTRLVVMVQREVGERLVAPAGTAAYGIPSVKVAYHATGAVVARVPATVFVPRPRVESVVVAIDRLDAPAVTADPAVLFPLVRRAFNQRRKMLRRSLAGAVPEPVLEAAGLDPTARPETVDVAHWGALADAVVAAGLDGAVRSAS